MFAFILWVERLAASVTDKKVHIGGLDRQYNDSSSYRGLNSSGCLVPRNLPVQFDLLANRVRLDVNPGTVHGLYLTH